MTRTYRLPAVAAILVGLGAIQPLDAQAIELTGVWSTSADLCKMVYTKKGNEIVFSELSDLYGSGFIIAGDRIRAKSANCTIKSRKQEGDTIELAAACATTIMIQDVRFVLKVIDDNTVSRVIPEIEGMALRYSRCTL